MIEQEIQNLTLAIRDLIAVMRQPAAPAAHVAEVDASASKVTEADDVAPSQAASEPKRRGRPPKTPPAAIQADSEAVYRTIESEVVEPEAAESAEVVEPETIEVVEEEATIEAIRSAIRDVIVAGGKDREDVTRKAIVRILAQHNNAKTLPELPLSALSKVLAAVRAIG